MKMLRIWFEFFDGPHEIHAEGSIEFLDKYLKE
jgi:hypothetical protein